VPPYHPFATPALDLALSRWSPLDSAAREAARLRQGELTKPPGSLGRLEELALHFAAMRTHPRPRIERALILIAAADHGVAARAVSAFPQSVTAAMVANFLVGGAAINCLAERAGASLCVVDAGVRPTQGGAPTTAAEEAAGSAGPLPRFVRVAAGGLSGDISVEPAFADERALRLLDAGVAFATRAASAGVDLMCLGEMGIGNTTVAAAVTGAALGLGARDVVGRGTGIDRAAFERKQVVVAAALARARESRPILSATEAQAWTSAAPGSRERATVLGAELGGGEILFLAGAALGAAAARVPVVLDGYITGAAALIAATVEPRVRQWLIAGHRSREPGHGYVLAHLGLDPLLDLDLALGEGSGAALALPIIASALAVHDRMATFTGAGVERATPRP